MSTEQRSTSDPILLDNVLPTYEFRGAVSVRIHAPPSEIFRAVDEVSLVDMPLAAALGTLRYLPGRLRGRPVVAASVRRSFVREVLPLAGNIELARAPDREVGLGAIGKIHQMLDQQPVHLTNAAAFRDFDDPAYQKLAMAIRIAGGDEQAGHRLMIEHRTHALSPAARRQFRRYWLVIKPGGNVASWRLLRAIKRRAERASSPSHASGWVGR